MHSDSRTQLLNNNYTTINHKQLQNSNSTTVTQQLLSNCLRFLCLSSASFVICFFWGYLSIKVLLLSAGARIDFTVTTDWIFYINLCGNSVKHSMMKNIGSKPWSISRSEGMHSDSRTQLLNNRYSKTVTKQQFNNNYSKTVAQQQYNNNYSKTATQQQFNNSYSTTTTQQQFNNSYLKTVTQQRFYNNYTTVTQQLFALSLFIFCFIC